MVKEHVISVPPTIPHILLILYSPWQFPLGLWQFYHLSTTFPLTVTAPHGLPGAGRALHGLSESLALQQLHLPRGQFRCGWPGGQWLRGRHFGDVESWKSGWVLEVIYELHINTAGFSTENQFQSHLIKVQVVSY